jgi:hypothetical protein
MACYRYISHPYSILPACRLHPGTCKDLAAIRGYILPSNNQLGYGSHHGKETSQTYSHIKDINKQDHIYRQTRSHQVSSYSSRLVWMESWENCLHKAASDPNQASQAGFSSNNTWLKKTECSKFQVFGYNELMVHHYRSCPFGRLSP